MYQDSSQILTKYQRLGITLICILRKREKNSSFDIRNSLIIHENDTLNNFSLAGIDFSVF